MRNATKKIVREALRIAASEWRRNALAVASQAADVDVDGIIALSEYYHEEADKADKLRRTRFHNQLSDRSHLAASEEAPRPLNLERAAAIMRRDLFGPLGVKVPEVPVAWAPPDFFKPDSEAVTHYEQREGGRPLSIGVNMVPSNRDPMRAAATLAHELAHVAAQPRIRQAERQEYGGHPEHWQRLARAIGLKLVEPWYTVPGPGFVRFYNEHLRGKA